MRIYYFEHNILFVKDGGYMAPKDIKENEEKFGALLCVRYKGRWIKAEEDDI